MIDNLVIKLHGCRNMLNICIRAFDVYDYFINNSSNRRIFCIYAFIYINKDFQVLRRCTVGWFQQYKFPHLTIGPYGEEQQWRMWTVRFYLFADRRNLILWELIQWNERDNSSWEKVQIKINKMK